MYKSALKLFGLGAALVVLALAAGNSGQVGLAQGSVTPGHMAVVQYYWPQLPVYWGGTQIGFYNFDVFLTTDVDPGTQSYYFWAHQFHFKEGDVGYMGLQTNGYMQGRWVGKMAIFSIWNAVAAKPGPGAACEWFTRQNGEGWSCRMQYNWVQGRTYRLRLWELCCAEKPWEDEWWGAWILDTTTGQEVFLGQIQVPASWQWLDWSQVWVQYYGSVSGCSAIPYAKARFERPSADNGSFRPQRLETDYGRTCANAKITLTGDQNQTAIFETGGNVRR